MNQPSKFHPRSFDDDFANFGLSILFALVIADMLPKPDKTPEEKLGEAINKYLTAGVKVRLPDDIQVKLKDK